MSADLPVAYILGTVPQPSQTFIAREVRGLLRQGVPLVVFALRRRSADLLEQDDRPWFNAVQFVPRTLAPAVLAANVQLLARQPARYLRTLARLVALQHRPSVLAVRAVSLFLRSVWIARQIARAGGCRLVHGHFALAQTEVAMATAGLLGCKFSFTAHARDIYASPSALEDKIRAAALVVSCTASNVAYLRSLCPDVMDRIHLAHHGVEVVEERAFAGAWTSQSEPARVPTILAAGRLVPKKGFDTLLEACARLRQRGVVFRCRLFGDGPEAARLRRLIDQSGIDACVTLAGWAPPSALLREMTSATVFAMPSRVSPRGDRDGLPNVILEAMASAVPVVATAVSGIPEAVVDGVTGLLVEPDNPEALADALERLLESRELRAAMGRAATERIRREFSLDAAADRMAALFEQVAPRPALQRQENVRLPPMMTRFLGPRPSAPVIADATQADPLAFKAREIEELVDVYFFRRLGIVLAYMARAAGLSPTGVTWIALAVGALGGAMVAVPAYGWLAVALLVFHGVLDSADGQLARLTRRTSDFGRLMDGVAGYVTHIAMYLGILASAFSRGSSWSLLPLAIIAGVSTAVHAQLYDYYRSTYVSLVTKGEATPTTADTAHTGLVAAYERLQRLLAGRHPAVERLLASRSEHGRITPGDRDRYRASFLGLVHGWNMMGDNVRRLSIAVAIWTGRPEWFIYAELVPLNALCAALWLRQRRADARFLDTR